MKILNKICWILAIVLGLGSVALFFIDFATLTAGSESVTAVGAELAFGSEFEIAGQTANIARSAHILFCFWVTAIAAVLSVVSFKSKKIRYATPVVGGIAGVYMLVIALSRATQFVDRRPFEKLVTKVEFTPFVLILAIALLAFTVVSAAYLLIDDYLEVQASKGTKLTIFKRVVRFFRDYKSEVKKIVWPGWKEVAKNTVIVLIICAIIGAFIWLIDWGLASLLELILGAK